MFKNKIVFLNYSFGELTVNILCLLISSLVFSGIEFYFMLFTNLFFVLINSYMLTWSIKNNVYDSDSLSFCNRNYSCFSFCLNSVWSSIKIFVLYQLSHYFYTMFLLSKEVWLTPNLTGLQVSTSLTLGLFSGILLLGFVFFCISTLLTKIGIDYTKECNDFIVLFKLNKNETSFCFENGKISGFISAGLHFDIKAGLIYGKFTFNQSEVVNYLRSNALHFSELTDDHLQIMRMYYV